MDVKVLPGVFISPNSTRGRVGNDGGVEAGNTLSLHSVEWD